MTIAYVSLLNRLIPTDLTYGDVRRLLSKNPLKLFDAIRDYIGEEFGRIDRVKLNDCRIEKGYISVEYFAYTKLSRIPVRVVCARDSAELLIEV